MTVPIWLWVCVLAFGLAVGFVGGAVWIPKRE